ncbi:hypothetical protein MBLNU459_g6897t1 [Dothideomycetes sp. NU459]
MHITPSILTILLSLCAASRAAPAEPAITAPASLEDRGLTVKVGVSVSGSASWSSILSKMTKVTATTTQKSVPSAISKMSSIHAAAPSANVFEYIASIVSSGLTTKTVTDLLKFVDGTLTGKSSTTNLNTRNSGVTIFPRKACGDAPYTTAEGTLRAAIYIPSTFTYGAIPPVILVPGTGNLGYQTYEGNFIPLLTGSSYADPVWLNIPGFLTGDAQINSEYVAYAINYISGISSNKNVSVIAWSQGNLDAQWAYKYWPSTRKITSNHIAISPDYDGTQFANVICPTGLLCDPSVLQQRYSTSSNFITTLRKNNGDSAYVPTTVLYSGLFDEIVEPQQGTGASAYLKDARGVGVTNNEVQLVCPGLPAGSFWTHESMLINPLAFALAKDALVHGGPGLPSRIDLTTVCNQFIPPGLNLGDFLLTENSVVISVLALILYDKKVIDEPAISAYALTSTTCPTSTIKSKTTSAAAKNKSTSSTLTSKTTSSTKAKTTSSTKKTTSATAKTTAKTTTSTKKTSSTTAKTTSSTKKATSTNAKATSSTKKTTSSSSSSNKLVASAYAA